MFKLLLIETGFLGYSENFAINFIECNFSQKEIVKIQEILTPMKSDNSFFALETRNPPIKIFGFKFQTFLFFLSFFQFF